MTVRPADDQRDADGASSAFVVDVDGYEGPIDVLLALAREQKVDLKHVSIVQLADQYLAFIAEARRRADLELAAEYLVMATWLAYLKSRLLLPAPEADGEPPAEAVAAALTFQLQRLEAMRTVGNRLLASRRLGHDVFARGQPERFAESTETVFEVGLHDLLRAYGAHLARREPRLLRIDASELSSVESALKRLSEALGRIAGWENLWQLLPPDTLDGLRAGRLAARSQLAATFTASLELTRSGKARLRQGVPFGPIYLAPAGRRGRDAEPE